MWLRHHTFQNRIPASLPSLACLTASKPWWSAVWADSCDDLVQKNASVRAHPERLETFESDCAEVDAVGNGDWWHTFIRWALLRLVAWERRRHTYTYTRTCAAKVSRPFSNLSLRQQYHIYCIVVLSRSTPLHFVNCFDTQFSRRLAFWRCN